MKSDDPGPNCIQTGTGFRIRTPNPFPCPSAASRKAALCSGHRGARRVFAPCAGFVTLAGRNASSRSTTGFPNPTGTPPGNAFAQGLDIVQAMPYAMDTHPPAAVAAGFYTSKYILVFLMRNKLLLLVFVLLSGLFTQEGKSKEYTSTIVGPCDHMSYVAPNSWTKSPRQICLEEINDVNSGSNDPISIAGPTRGPTFCATHILRYGGPEKTYDWRGCVSRMRAYCHRENGKRIKFRTFIYIHLPYLTTADLGAYLRIEEARCESYY